MDRSSSRIGNSFVLLLLLAAAVLPLSCSGDKAKREPRKVDVKKNEGNKDEETSQRKADVKDFVKGEVLQVPYIFWGGDVATYLANGGQSTQADSLFHKHGLKLNLVRGDDFAAQVKDYKEGKSPFLRGTMSMLGQVAEDVCDLPEHAHGAAQER